MFSLETLSSFIDGRIKRVDNNILLAQRHKMETFLQNNEKRHLVDIKTVIELLRNDPSLHPRKCEACGKLFIPKAENQRACEDRCRVRLHRSRNQLKIFNGKVTEILRAKDPEARFTVEQLISSEGKCPFIVNYNGKQYQSDSTRNLLTQLKKI